MLKSHTHLFITTDLSIYYLGVDTKQRLSKQRHHKTATVTKQRQLQNSDSYKTATVTKQRLL